MDNEKKTPKDVEGQKKQRPPRRKGYFINPNADKAQRPEGQEKQERTEKQNRNDKSAKQGENTVRNENENARRHNRPTENNATDRQSSEPKDNTNSNSSNSASGGNSSNRSRNNHRRRGNRPHGDAQKHAEAKAEAKQEQKNDKVAQKPENKNEQKRDRNRDNRKNDRADANSAAKAENRREQSQTENAPVAQSKRHGKKHGSENRAQKTATLMMSLNEEPAPKPALSEPEEILDPAAIPADILESPASITIPKITNDEKERVEVVGIRFKSSGKVYYFDPHGKTYRRGSHAIVETARGQEYGEVAMGNTRVKASDVVPPLRPILRAATDADEAHNKDNRKREDDAFRICNEKIIAHQLDMKLIDAQYTFDNSKLLFYFTSSGRVDFRDLVKDLASVFRTRIELRQIGIRDEAKLMGGLGLCGRPLCCSLFLTDFGQVSIKMAKEQNLSLNSAKISGICGRLMCCLRYEHETYEYEIKRTPPVDSLVQTPDGNGVVIENSPLAGTVKVRLSVTPEVPPKIYKRDDVTVLQKKAPKSNDNN